MHFARPQIERDTLQRLHGVKVFGDLTEFEHTAVIHKLPHKKIGTQQCHSAEPAGVAQCGICLLNKKTAHSPGCRRKCGPIGRSALAFTRLALKLRSRCSTSMVSIPSNGSQLKP